MISVRTYLQSIALAGAIASIYWLIDRLGLNFSLSAPHFLPPWPASGAALAGILLFGKRLWPGVWLGTFAVYAMELQEARVGSPLAILGTGALIASGNCLMGLAGSVLLTRHLGGGQMQGWRGPLFAKVDALWFAAVALGICLVSAGVSSMALWAYGMAPPGEYLTLGLTWWLGDVAGVMIVTPFLLAWSRPPQEGRLSRNWGASAFAIGLLLLICRVVYSGRYTSEGRALPLAFLIIAPLAWVAIRGGPRATTTAVLLLALVATWHTVHHLGPLAIGTVLGSQLLLYGFLLAVAIPAHALESDSTARREANENLERRVQERVLELERSSQRFNAFMRNLPGVAFMKDPQGRYIYASDRVDTVTGLSAMEVLGMKIQDLWPADAARVSAQDEEMRRTGRPIQTVETLPMEDGVHYWLMHKFPIPDNTGNSALIGGMAIDITARIVAEQRVEAALKKEEVLKREIHHRVKNNLQVVISMLYLQSAEIRDPAARAALLECQSRTRSIALIYALLSESENLESIEFAQYAHHLTADLLTAYRASPESVAVAIEAEGIFLSVDASLPCGLILTELVSNSLKYAFADGRQGRIAIELQAAENGLRNLTVRDNGIGLPADFDLENPRTLGCKLVRDLTRQLGGELTCTIDHGTSMTVSFPTETEKRKGEP